MPLQTRWDSGDWNAICDICGFKFKASQLVENWKKQKVCKDDWEPMHPQLFLRPRKEKTAVAWARPDEVVTNTIYTSDPGITADLVNVIWYFDPTSSAFSVALPAANASGFHKSQVTYIMNNVGSVHNITITSTGHFTGSVTILPGQTARFTAEPESNLWYRN